jgi:MFS family permease
MPFLTRQGPTVYAVLIAGLVGSAAAFALLQASCDLSLLILARAIQGFAAAAITAASSALLATATRHGSTCGLSLLTPATIQSAAMATAPVVAGLLHDRYDVDVVFYCAYALVALNLVLSIAAINTKPIHQVNETDETARLYAGSEPAGYGTMPVEAGGYSRRSSRSISPTSLPAVELSQRRPSANLATTPWSPRLVVALAGYFVVGLLTSALHGVLPLFVQRHLSWSVLTSGSMFAPLSAPAAVMGPLAGMLAARVPRSARFLTAIGFLACIPAFIYLGQLWANKSLVEHGFLLTLSGLSLAIGLCGDPLAKEIANAVGSSTRDPWSAAALTTNLPTLANAWGSLAGPLFAGAVSWLWGWQTMSISLAVVAAATGVLSLLFLQGWIWNPYPDVYSQRLEPSSDEESAPLLANERSNRNLYGQPEGRSSGKDSFFRERQGSDDVSPHTRSDTDGKRRSHRRHFSVDNFSVATTTTPGSLDSSTSSVRFQAALETPAQGPVAKRPQTGDSASKASAERRYVMREAPHAPATDPLLAAGSLYVIDEERDTARGTERQRQKRRVVVFPEGSAPPDLLARHRHHVVAINALDGTTQMVSESTDNHAVHVTEEDGEEFEEGSSRRYVVVVVEGEDA